MYKTVLQTVLLKLVFITLILSASFSCLKSFVEAEESTDISLTSIVSPIDSVRLSQEKDTSLIELPNGLVLMKIGDSYHWDDMCFSEEGLDILYNKTRSAAIDLAKFYWPYGKVYYKFNSNIPTSERVYYYAAMNEISSLTSIEFLPKGTSNSKYIEFKSDSKNSSPVGMQSNGQIIRINDAFKNIIAHEIMHSLGFFHEHSRADRDSSIIVNLYNIRDAYKHDFQKYTVSNSGMDIGPFDFNSLMIYNSDIRDPKYVYDTSVPAMSKIDGSPFYQGSTLSSHDIEGVSSIYGPPFHRLEHHRLRIIENSVSGNLETYITENSDSIVFYADKNCTTRQALTYPRVLKIQKVISTNQGIEINDVYYDFSITIPAGTISYPLWHGYNYMCYFCSYPENYHVVENSIINILVTDKNYFHN